MTRARYWGRRGLCAVVAGALWGTMAAGLTVTAPIAHAAPTAPTTQTGHVARNASAARGAWGRAGGTVPRSFSYSAPQPGYTLTLVARQCPRYSDVMANGSRSNIMEALQDLGKDSVYSRGQPVSPDIDEPNDPNCTPLNGWKFDIGTSYKKPGQLSVVTGRFATAGPTTDNVPWLGQDGLPTGRTLDGAVVYHLTDADVENSTHQSLWVQGGLVDDPEMDKTFGSKYGFASLRCAIDNWNADNVEYVAYPQSARNVFCYAYYVTPRPDAGTVTIKKEVTSPGVSQGFTFTSNLSYDPSGTFPLQVNNGTPASEDFIRAQSSSFGGPYDVTEQIPAGWSLTGLACESTRGTSTWTIDRPGAHVSIDLMAGDHVTCTYRDSPPPPPHRPVLTVAKITSGGTGGPFRFAVDGPVSHDLTATTSAAETATEATEGGTSPDDYVAGDYTITETMPAPTEAGHWQFQEAYCNAHPIRAARATARTEAIRQVKLTDNEGQDCYFRNTFVPNGHLIIRLKTLGGTGTGWFYRVVNGQNTNAHSATTTSPGVPATAFDQGGLPLEQYIVQSATPLTDPDRGTWKFVSFTCDKGSYTPSTPQNLAITLTRSEPLADCTAVYRFIPATTVDLVKTASGPSALRSGPAIVDIGCGSQARGRVVLPAGVSEGSLPAPLYLHKHTRCTVTERRTGAIAPLNWTGHAAVNGRPLGLPGSFRALPAGRRYVVRVDNRYRPAVIPGS